MPIGMPLADARRRVAGFLRSWSSSGTDQRTNRQGGIPSHKLGLRRSASGSGALTGGAKKAKTPPKQDVSSPRIYSMRGDMDGKA